MLVRATLKVGGFGLGRCWGWQNEFHVVKHRERWRAQQPPRVPLTHRGDWAFVVHSPSLSLPAIAILSAPCRDCLQFPMCCIRHAWSSLLKHTQRSWPCFTHMRGDTLVQILHTQHLCTLSTLWKRPKLPRQRKPLGSTGAFFSSECETGQWHSCVAISWIGRIHRQRVIVLTVLW